MLAIFLQKFGRWLLITLTITAICVVVYSVGFWLYQQYTGPKLPDLPVNIERQAIDTQFDKLELERLDVNLTEARKQPSAQSPVQSEDVRADFQGGISEGAIEFHPLESVAEQIIGYSLLVQDGLSTQQAKELKALLSSLGVGNAYIRTRTQGTHAVIVGPWQRQADAVNAQSRFEELFKRHEIDSDIKILGYAVPMPKQH